MSTYGYQLVLTVVMFFLFIFDVSYLFLSSESFVVVKLYVEMSDTESNSSSRTNSTEDLAGKSDGPNHVFVHKGLLFFSFLISFERQSLRFV